MLSRSSVAACFLSVQKINACGDPAETQKIIRKTRISITESNFCSILFILGVCAVRNLIHWPPRFCRLPSQSLLFAADVNTSRVESVETVDYGRLCYATPKSNAFGCCCFSMLFSNSVNLSRIDFESNLFAVQIRILCQFRWQQRKFVGMLELSDAADSRSTFLVKPFDSILAE